MEQGPTTHRRWPQFNITGQFQFVRLRFKGPLHIIGKKRKCPRCPLHKATVLNPSKRLASASSGRSNSPGGARSNRRKPRAGIWAFHPRPTKMVNRLHQDSGARTYQPIRSALLSTSRCQVQFGSFDSSFERRRRNSLR